MLPKSGVLPHTSNIAEWSNNLEAVLRGALPHGWSLSIADEPRRRASVLELVPPRGPIHRFVIETVTHIDPRQIARLGALKDRFAQGERLLVIAPHVSRRTQEVLKRADISYFDLTGNVWLTNDSLLIERAGSGKALRLDNPRARSSLRGPITGRIVRVLCARRPPFKVRQIALDAHVNAGNISRLLEFLEREHYVRRSDSGSVVDVDWEGLLQRWSTDLMKDRHVESLLDPHGVQNVLGALVNWAEPYAITGAFASSKLAPVAAPISLDVYVENVDAAISALSLHRSERIGNIRLIEAFDRVVFDGTMTIGGIVLAAPPQIAADILTLPMRSREEYTALIQWMKQHESAWRT
jgi:hypothetical protein